MPSPQSERLIEVDGLKMHFPIHSGVFQRQVNALKAVDGVTFHIDRGETLGLVGESGCGKSTTGRCLLRMHDYTGGSVRFREQDLATVPPAKLRTMRRDMQLIFQDPYASLDPRMTCEDIIAEPLVVQKLGSAEERGRRVTELLDLVELSPSMRTRYPHEFSGGQRQRIGIARALAVNPEFIVCDEPVSALDVSIQAQIVSLLMKLREELGLTYLFIAHDLAVVRNISDRVAVMYLGRIVEISSSAALYDEPLHPYTISLLSAVPIPDPIADRKRERIVLKGEIPSPVNPPSGCPFHTRCPRAIDMCSKVVPLLEVKREGHMAACHLVD